MPLIYSETNLTFTWPKNCVFSNDTKTKMFAITDTKLYVPIENLSTQDKAKLLWQLKSGFKRTINWYRFEPKGSVQALNPYLDVLINRSFQGVNKCFLLSFENKADRIVQTKHYLLTVAIKDYNVMVDGQNFFDNQLKIT